MPTPLPHPDQTLLEPPDQEEVQATTDGVLSAIRLADGPTEFQTLLVRAAFESLTGHTPDTTDRPVLSAAAFAAGMARRNEAFRNRILQTMILGALVLRPLPTEVADRIGVFARELSVDDGMLAVAQGFASGQLGLAAVDFERNGYTSDWSPERAQSLHTSSGVGGGLGAVGRRPRAGRPLGRPGGSPGRDPRVVGCGSSTGPGGSPSRASPGSAPPLLAQHDWVHVLADYGTKVESELEVFALIARANDDPRGFSLLAMVVSLFETGYLETGAGLFEAFPGQLSQEGMATRVADALRRGALSRGLDGEPDIDLLGVDWFELADQPVEELRERLHVVAKADGARDAGSVGPWEPGGISEFQYNSARATAEEQGRVYDSHGAVPEVS